MFVQYNNITSLGIFCTLFANACASSNTTDMGYLYSSVSDKAEGRYLKDYRYTNVRPYSRVLSTPKQMQSGIIKTRMVESSSGMDIEDNQPYWDGSDDKHLHYNYKYNYPMSYGNMGYGNGYYEPHPHHGLGHYTYERDMDGKEAMLKGFGVGLAIGLGALGAVSSLLKFSFIPLLALAALLPLLLLLSIPIPVITSGKMLASHKKNNLESGHLDLQEAIDELMKRIPKLKKISIKKSKLKL